MARERKYDDDDGRTIVDMNVEGMPWYEKDKRRRARADSQTHYAPFSERLRDAFSAMLAGLVVVGIMGLSIIAFILFCTNVWLQ